MTAREIHGRLHAARKSIGLLKHRHGSDPSAWDAKVRDEFEKLKRICRALQWQTRTAG